MAWTPPGAGALRHSIRFERRVDSSDGIGGVASTWSPLATVAAQVSPMRGGEEVRAARLSGVSNYELVVRSTPTTITVTPADRAVDTRSGQTFNVKWTGDLEGRGRFLMILAEAGGLTDG